MIEVVDATAAQSKDSRMVIWLYRWPITTAVGRLAICLAWRHLADEDHADIRADRLRLKTEGLA